MFRDLTVWVERVTHRSHKTGRGLACSLRVLSKDGSVCAGDDHIDDILDCHEAVNELLERDTIFRHEARVPEPGIVHHTHEENRSQLPEVVGHRLSSFYDVVPAQGRTGDDENETEK
jgi:hypothetical protein